MCLLPRHRPHPLQQPLLPLPPPPLLLLHHLHL
jgi:hypothetical protein